MSYSDAKHSPWFWLLVLPLIPAVLIAALSAGGLSGGRVEAIATAPAATGETPDGQTVEVPMAEMIQLAENALAATIAGVDDYTTRMIKQEQDRSGVLQPASESFMKIATRHPGGKPGSPMRVYLRFDSPNEVRGREVIWVENENDGNLLVREAGMLGALGTIPLPPEGMLAMRGQRYPITEIGLTRLLEKLIERGSRDRDNPDVRVFFTEGYVFDDARLTHLRIERDQPSGLEGDFSIAELVLDRERNLIVSFRSFGWPKKSGGEPVLIESYEYLDLKINVGLTDRDFDTSNPDYTFAK